MLDEVSGARLSYRLAWRPLLLPSQGDSGSAMGVRRRIGPRRAYNAVVAAVAIGAEPSHRMCRLCQARAPNGRRAMRDPRGWADWENLARRDPLWAILTEPQKKGNRWGVEEFFATGRREIDELLAYLDSLGIRPARHKALDFGCGVGRLTQALAGHFEEACGVDAAPTMIELAVRHGTCGGKCRYSVNQSSDLRQFADGTFDFVCSLITLQHIPQDQARSYMIEFLRVLAPGGVLVFQLPSEPRGTPIGFLLRVVPPALLDMARGYGPSARMAMHAIPKREVISLLELHGARVPAQAPVKVWRERAGLRVQGQLQFPAQDLTRVYGFSKLALGMGVTLGRWHTVFMGLDAVLVPAATD